MVSNVENRDAQGGGALGRPWPGVVRGVACVDAVILNGNSAPGRPAGAACRGDGRAEAPGAVFREGGESGQGGEGVRGGMESGAAALLLADCALRGFRPARRFHILRIRTAGRSLGRGLGRMPRRV